MRHITLVTLFLAITVSTCAAAGTGLFHRNLIVNPGAESGSGAPDSGTLVDIPGWTGAGHFDVVQYGASGGFPAVSDPGPKNRGKNFFSGGPDQPLATATQTISVAPAATAIATGKVRYELSGYIGGYAGQNDAATVTAQFQDANGKTLASGAIGPVSAADRDGKTGLLLRKHDGMVPAGTKQIRVIITANRSEGSYNDGECDDLSLVLAQGA